MKIQIITKDNPLWDKLIDYAAGCSWHGGGFLAEDMKNNHFQDWERVIVATEPCPKTEKDQIAGFATVAKTDVINLVSYTPYIGYVFVDEAFRGSRLSQRMINFAMAYLKEVGFQEVYLVSNHENLYEKYGFTVIDRQPAYWGDMEKIYWQAL